jgi:hypothetical protein
MARYTLYQTGPDNSSTYAECWGSTRTSRGRVVASASTLVGLMDAVDQFDHDNWSIYGPGARYICGSRRHYYALPSVAKELARIARVERKGV